MARMSRVFGSIVVLAVLGVGAYELRDRWLPAVERLAGYTQAGPADNAGNTRSGGSRSRRGGQFQGPVSVLVATARSVDVPVYIDGVGSVRPLNTVNIRPEISGKLVEIDFEEGQDVRKGAVLARIDDAIYRAQLDQAIGKKAQDTALLQNAQVDLERYQRLVQSSSGTQQQADTARSQVAQYQAQIQSDQAAIESAQATLAYTTITAPMDGRTGIRNVDVGNLVSASDTTGIVTLSQIKPISVLFSVPQQQLARLTAANGAGQLTVQALSSDQTTVIDTGVLAVVDNQVDATTGTVKLKANFANDKLALWPGAFVNTRLLVDTLKNVVTVPAASVQRGPNGTFVYLVQPDDTVAMHAVTVGQQDDTQAVVTAGVAAGDRIVTTGFAGLRDGAKISVSEQPDTGPKTDPAPDGNGASPRRHHKKDAANSEKGGADTSAKAAEPGQ